VRRGVKKDLFYHMGRRRQQALARAALID
jgi:hypothetical protein